MEEDPMTLSTPDESGAASLEAIARNGSLLRRIAVRQGIAQGVHPGLSAREHPIIPRG